MARPKSIPGLALLLGHLPLDVRQGLADLTDEQAYFYTVGWMSCAAERVSQGYQEPDSQLEIPPVQVAIGVKPPSTRPLPEYVPPPPGEQELAIGRYPSAVVSEVIGYAVANSTNPKLARVLAARQLQLWEPNCAAPPGRWPVAIQALLTHPGEQQRSIWREVVPEENPIQLEGNEQVKGAFAEVDGEMDG